MERLLTEGEFPHILLRICRQLSATELACLECVSKAWRCFIQQNIWGSDFIARQELFQTRKIVEGTRGPFYTIGRLSYPLLIL